jgi:hypothetical protein
MRWPEFRHCIERQDAAHAQEPVADLVWRSPCDADGIEVGTDACRALDLGQTYWHQVVAVAEDGAETYLYGSEQTVTLPPGTKSARTFALPPDGRDNSPNGFKARVPVPVVVEG